MNAHSLPDKWRPQNGLSPLWTLKTNIEGPLKREYLVEKNNLLERIKPIVKEELIKRTQDEEYLRRIVTEISDISDNNVKSVSSFLFRENSASYSPFKEDRSSFYMDLNSSLLGEEICNEIKNFQYKENRLPHKMVTISTLAQLIYIYPFLEKHIHGLGLVKLNYKSITKPWIENNKPYLDVAGEYSSAYLREQFSPIPGVTVDHYELMTPDDYQKKFQTITAVYKM